jgi:ATP synthase F1 gamma subunit
MLNAPRHPPPTTTMPPTTPTQTLFNAMLENNCSEHASRMSAMENSSKNAGEILNGLTLQYNRDRQATITNELIEVGLKGLTGG